MKNFLGLNDTEVEFLIWYYSILFITVVANLAWEYYKNG